MSNAVATTGILVKRKPISFSIVSNSVANPSVVTTSVAHDLTSGDSVTISGVTGGTPSINGTHVVTVISPTTFSIPVNASVGGTGGTGAPQTYMTIGEITKATPPGFSRNKIETSTHNDGAESYILGILRQKDGAFTINYVAGDTSHAKLLADILANRKATWQFVFPSGITMTGDARVQQFQITDAPVDGAQAADIVLAWAGAIVQA